MLGIHPSPPPPQKKGQIAAYFTTDCAVCVWCHWGKQACLQFAHLALEYTQGIRNWNWMTMLHYLSTRNKGCLCFPTWKWEEQSRGCKWTNTNHQTSGSLYLKQTNRANIQSGRHVSLDVLTWWQRDGPDGVLLSPCLSYSSIIIKHVFVFCFTTQWGCIERPSEPQLIPPPLTNLWNLIIFCLGNWCRRGLHAFDLAMQWSADTYE